MTTNLQLWIFQQIQVELNIDLLSFLLFLDSITYLMTPEYNISNKTLPKLVSKGNTAYCIYL